MNRHSDNPLRLFVDPFAAWRELALKTGEMIVASACAAAGRASAARVAVIDQREPVRPPAALRAPKARGPKKHKKRAKRR